MQQLSNQDVDSIGLLRRAVDNQIQLYDTAGELVALRKLTTLDEVLSAVSALAIIHDDAATIPENELRQALGRTKHDTTGRDHHTPD